MTDFTVIGGPSSEQLAKKIASKLKSKFIGCELRVFPDGESKITLKGKPSGKILVVQSIYPPVDSNLLRCLAIISQARAFSSKVYLVIPYMAAAFLAIVGMTGCTTGSQNGSVEVEVRAIAPGDQGGSYEVKVIGPGEEF